MIGLRAGELDRRITLLQPQETGRDDWNNPIIGRVEIAKVWAKKTDVSDAERVRAQEVGATITTRFVIRYSSQVRNVDPTHLIAFDGRIYDISAVKEVGRREGLEITATARAEREQA